MIIGVVKEIKNNENRVALTPAGAEAFRAAGHQVLVETGAQLTKGYRCDLAHIRDVIAKFPAEDRADMADETGEIFVDCEFCSRRFPLSLVSFNN